MKKTNLSEFSFFLISSVEHFLKKTASRQNNSKTLFQTFLFKFFVYYLCDKLKLQVYCHKNNNILNNNLKIKYKKI